jgi:hypothetical protein
LVRLLRRALLYTATSSAVLPRSAAATISASLMSYCGGVSRGVGATAGCRRGSQGVTGGQCGDGVSQGIGAATGCHRGAGAE